MAVVYCPRTHAWFGHARYPLEKLLAAGAIVALGTDSRASSPDLSLLAEMRHVAREFPAMSRATILELGTLGGARALGLDARHRHPGARQVGQPGGDCIAGRLRGRSARVALGGGRRGACNVGLRGSGVIATNPHIGNDE